MNFGRMSTYVASVTVATCTIATFSNASPRKGWTPIPTFRVGHVDAQSAQRGGGIVHCDTSNFLVTENFDIGTIIPSN